MEGVLADLGGLVVADGEKGFVADDVRDFAPYGLDSPAMTIELAPLADSGAPQTLLVGKEVPDRADRIYARRGDQDDVVWIDAKALRAIGISPDALRSQRVADIQPAEVNFVQVEALGRVFELVRTPSGWDLVRSVAREGGSGGRPGADPRPRRAASERSSSTRRRWTSPASSPRP